jgi:hypothetical protein
MILSHALFSCGASQKILLMRKPIKLMELRALIICVSEFLKIWDTSVHIHLEEVLKQKSGLIKKTCALETIIHTSDL